jgi:hypothetical protein
MAEDKTTAEEQAAAVDLDATLVRPGGFFENPNHTPNPFFQYGTVDTSGLGAPEHQQMAAISPVFEAARADAKERAQADEADRLAATREGSAGSADRASQVAADRAVGSRDIGADSAPVAGSSATPSAATPDKDTKASSAASRRTTSDNSKK